jgi:hypothetical protein
VTSGRIIDGGDDYILQGSLAGRCDGESHGQISLPKPTSNAVTYTFGGQSHTATRNAAGGQISDVNRHAPQCNTILTPNYVSSAAALSSGGSLTLAIVGMLVVSFFM